MKSTGLYQNQRIKSGILTSFSEAFENSVGWYGRGLFDHLADAVRSVDNPLSRSYEFTHIFNLEPQYVQPSPDPEVKVWSHDQHSVIIGDDGNVSTPSLEQITSRFFDHEELKGGLDAHDIDLVVLYCFPIPVHSDTGVLIKPLQKYADRIIEFPPFNFSNPHFERERIYKTLGKLTTHAPFMEKMRYERKNRLTEREADARFTIDDVNDYLGYK